MQNFSNSDKCKFQSANLLQNESSTFLFVFAITTIIFMFLLTSSCLLGGFSLSYAAMAYPQIKAVVSSASLLTSICHDCDHD